MAGPGFKSITFAGVSVFALVAGGQAAAQTILEEVVVTAQKREESAQSIGIAITAFNGDMVRKLGFQDPLDITAQTPSLNFGLPGGRGANPSFVLRGVGLNDFNDTNEPPVAMYKDDVYIGALGGQDFQLFDVERIEILRGPQGTLYGRNASGGLLHFISRRPTAEFEGYGEVTVGEYSQVKLEGAVSGPISEHLRFRAAGTWHRDDGFYENRIGKDVADTNDIAGRLQLEADLNERLTALVILSAGDRDINGPGYKHRGTATFNPDAFCFGQAPTDCIGYADTDPDVHSTALDFGGIKTTTYAAQLNLEYEADAFTLTSISAWNDLERENNVDADAGPYPYVHPEFDTDHTQYSQELRLSGPEENRLRWVTGLYYYRADVEGLQRLTANIIAGGENLGPAARELLLFDQSTESYAAFGQVDYDLVESLTLSAGLRYTREEKDTQLTNTNQLTGDVFSFTDATANGLNEQTSNQVSGKLGLEYHIDDDKLVFASFSRGFKSGGFNLGFYTPATDITTLPYGKETLNSYEIGVKTTWPEINTRLNVTGFYYDYKDFQGLTFLGVNQILRNADATIKGIEAELALNPLDGLEFLFGATYLDATAKGITDGLGVTANRDMVLAPEWSFNGLARYEWDMLAGRTFAQFDFNYQGSHYFDIQNTPVSYQDSYFVGNARIGYISPDDTYQVTLWVKNLFDAKYHEYTFDLSGLAGLVQDFYAPPRWFGATLNVNF